MRNETNIRYISYVNTIWHFVFGSSWLLSSWRRHSSSHYPLPPVLHGVRLSDWLSSCQHEAWDPLWGANRVTSELKTSAAVCGCMLNPSAALRAVCRRIQVFILNAEQQENIKHRIHKSTAPAPQAQTVCMCVSVSVFPTIHLEGRPPPMW